MLNTDDHRAAIGGALRKLIKQKNTTYEKLAAATGFQVGSSTIQRIAKGETDAKLRVLELILAQLDSDVPRFYALLNQDGTASGSPSKFTRPEIDDC